MSVYYTTQTLTIAIESKKALSKSIGFVPTMGALHEGHLALVKKALSEVDVVIVSIFVNPIQFNNKADLEKYPRMLNKDIDFLGKNENILIFAPDYNEVYPSNDSFEKIELNGMDRILEGKFRPGHFQGVMHVVRNLFQIVLPNKAYFGLKDFQQVAIIKKMVIIMNLPIDIVACSTLRETSGLAMSSRNLRLTGQEKVDALIIFNTLNLLRDLKLSYNPNEAKKRAIHFFNKSNLELEYLEIVDGNTLESIGDSWITESTCCIAAMCGEVRLIDNIQL
jgi:pantoate--beta-alanine ligase